MNTDFSKVLSAEEAEELERKERISKSKFIFCYKHTYM